MYRILHPRVMVIGGDPDSPDSPVRALSSVGVDGRITFARVGEEALRMLDLAQRAGLPHLILLDFKPPAAWVPELERPLDPRTLELFLRRAGDYWLQGDPELPD